MDTSTIYIDYSTVIPNVTKMVENGISFNANMSNAYAKVEEMKETWKGRRYNSLAASFNNMSGTINSMLDQLLDSIPERINIAAQKYANADTSSIPAFQKQSIKYMPTLDQNTPDTTLKYSSATTMDIENYVETLFDSAIGEVDEAVAAFAAIDWDSPAHTMADAEIRSTSQKIKNEIEATRNSFKDFVSNADVDITEADK